MKLMHAANKHAGRSAAEEPAPTPHPGAAETGLRALLVVEAGNPPFEAAEFLKRMLTGGSRVRILTVRPYQFQGDSPWSSLGAHLQGSHDPDPADHQITLRILEGTGARISTKQRFGSAPDEILEEASDWGADVILVGHYNGLGRWFQGSVADNLLKRSVVPVLVVPHLSPVHQAAESGRTLESVRLQQMEPDLT